MKNHYLLMSLWGLFALSLSLVSCGMDDKADEATPRLGISQARYELALQFERRNKCCCTYHG